MLAARCADFDFDNLLLTVHGNGRKERRVPFGIDLRKVLFRFVQFQNREGVRSELMFPARQGGRCEQRNARPELGQWADHADMLRESRFTCDAARGAMASSQALMATASELLRRGGAALARSEAALARCESVVSASVDT